jgi:hypothetical protein
MLIREESPYGINLFLAEPSDNPGGEPIGQDPEPVIDADPILGEPAEPSYFHSYEDEEGKKTDFKDANEVNDFIRRSGMMRADYSRKTQTLAGERRTYEADKARTDAEYTTFLTSKQENDKIEKLLQSLPPEVFERLKLGIKGQPKKQARDPEVDQMLKDYANDKKERETEKQQSADNTAREKAFESLGKSYDDFDKESVMEMVKGLEEVPPEDQMRTFMEMLYHSQKGKMTPAEIERKMAENLERKSKTPVPMGHTAKVPNTGEKKYSNLKEAREAAMEELDF